MSGKRDEVLAHDNLRYRTLDAMRKAGVEPGLDTVAASLEGFFWNPKEGFLLSWQEADGAYPGEGVYTSPTTGTDIEFWLTEGMTPQLVCDVLSSTDVASLDDANWATFAEEKGTLWRIPLRWAEHELSRNPDWLYAARRDEGTALDEALTALGIPLPPALAPDEHRKEGLTVDMWKAACEKAMEARLEQAHIALGNDDVAWLADHASTADYLRLYSDDEPLFRAASENPVLAGLDLDGLEAALDSIAFEHQFADYALATENDFRDRALQGIVDYDNVLVEASDVRTTETAGPDHEEEL